MYANELDIYNKELTQYSFMYLNIPLVLSKYEFSREISHKIALLCS